MFRLASVKCLVDLVTGAFGDLAPRLRVSYPVSFRDLSYIKWTRSSLRNVAFIADLDSFSYRQNSRAFIEEQFSYKTLSQ